MNELTIIIPTLNEAKTVRNAVNTIMYVLQGKHEVMVIDDNSTDGTQDILKDLASIYPNFSYHIRHENHGLSESLTEAFSLADTNILMVVDCDGQWNFYKIPEVYQAIVDGNDVALGSRYLGVEGSGFDGFPYYRRLISWGATYLAQFFFPDVKDSGSGFFAFRKEVIKDAPLKPQGFRMLFEILGKGNWKTAKEIPVVFVTRKEGESKLTTKTILSYIKQLWGLLIYSIQTPSSHGHREIVRVITFGVVGITGIIVNLGITYILTEIQGMWYMHAAVFGIEVSILTNFLLNDTITFWDVNKNPILKRLGLYHIACFGGVLITIATLFVGVRLNVYYMLALFLGICLAFLWNFSFSRGIAWGK